MMRLGAWLCAILLASCATPMPPTGGPPDEMPPQIEASTPVPGSVNVSGETIRITFSEYVDEGSFSQALSISPDPAVAAEISWSGRSVEIRLPDGFRPNTTYVVTLDTELRDVRNVALTSPVTLAFSTGPTISTGRLSGRVVLPRTADPAAGVDVFAYARPDSSAPDSLPARPAYRTQTEPSGAFSFTHLTEQYYYVIGLRDENRNVALDPQEPFAAPPAPAVFADTVAAPLERPWVLTRLDTTRPAPLRVQSLSSTRHALRLSEPVRFVDRDPSAWSLRDSTTEAPVDVTDLYIQPNDPRQVFFTTPHLDPVAHLLHPSALADTSGNPVLDQAVGFTPSTAEDTVQVRFLAFLPAAEVDYTLPRGLEPGIRFNAPIGETLLGQAVSVVDSNGTALAFSALTDDGTTYRLVPEPPLIEAGPVEVRIDGSTVARGDSTLTGVYQRLPASETGEIQGVVASPIEPVVVEVFPEDVEGPVPRYEVVADSGGTFLFSGLPAGTYRLRAFADGDENGAWSGGMLQPYVEPEPIEWSTEPTRVRPRWETSLPDTLRIRHTP